MSFTKAIHLEKRADEITARPLFPVLLRKLISVTSPKTILNMPGNEQVYRPGFDGKTESNYASRFVPSGTCFW